MESATADNEEDEDWANSKAKSILRTGILSGEITAEMKPKEVFDLNPAEHGKWNYQNWSNNLRALRQAIERDRERMQRDCISYGHDLAIIKSMRDKNKPTPWHRSEASPLLKQDVKDGKHKQQKPEELHKSRPEYQAFGLSEFRNHIYQEKDAEPKRAIRFEKKKTRWRYPELHASHPRLQNNNNDEDDNNDQDDNA